MSDIENGQHWLDRNRPPRVQITYDVEIGDAFEKKELPLVMGIIADLSSKIDAAGLGLAKRAFVSIDRDNFNNVLSDISPTCDVKMTSVLQNGSDGKAAEFLITLTFQNMADFDPINIVKNDPALNALYEERQCLRDMLTRLDGNVPLEIALTSTFNTPNKPAAVTPPAELSPK